MRAQISRWGNSLGVRIPKDVAGQAGLAEGAQVEISMEDERIVLSPVQPRYALGDLLRGMTPKAMHKAFDWGPDRGRESVDE